MHMKMSFMFFDLVVPPLWLPSWSVFSSFCMSPHYDLSSHNLCNVCQSSMYYFFLGTTYLIFCGIDSAILAYAIVIFSSHNIIASLCCCNVDCFIPVVVILKYDCKLVLNTIVRKLSMVSTCKP